MLISQAKRGNKGEAIHHLVSNNTFSFTTIKKADCICKRDDGGKDVPVFDDLLSHQAVVTPSCARRQNPA